MDHVVLQADGSRLTQSGAVANFDLKTVGPANRAYLAVDKAGRIYLCFRGLPYGVDDFVPNSLVGDQAAWPSSTAGEFVCRQMLQRHGRNEGDWPELARRFLLSHAPVRQFPARAHRIRISPLRRLTAWLRLDTIGRQAQPQHPVNDRAGTFDAA
ncbi:MAG TPA: hypothetical protein VF460_06430 [Burkholderiales bacterium]